MIFEIKLDPQLVQKFKSAIIDIITFRKLMLLLCDIDLTFHYTFYHIVDQSEYL